MISYPLERKAIKYESKATASNMAKALAVLVLLESLIVIGLIWLLETADTTTISILVVITLLPLTIAWMLWFHQLKVQVLDNGILLSGTKPLFGFKNRFVPFADISEAKAGYHLSGFGFGFGIRKEGKKQTIWRVSGPEVTLVLADGSRLAMSVENEAEFLSHLPPHLVK